jgi:hypothetical protein
VTHENDKEFCWSSCFHEELVIRFMRNGTDPRTRRSKNQQWTTHKDKRRSWDQLFNNSNYRCTLNLVEQQRRIVGEYLWPLGSWRPLPWQCRKWGESTGMKVRLSLQPPPWPSYSTLVAAWWPLSRQSCMAQANLARSSPQPSLVAQRQPGAAATRPLRL